MNEYFSAVCFALVLIACAPSAPSVDAPEGSLFAGAPEQQWRLPRQLNEISGLAVSPDGRVFAHDDETAMLYEIDAVQGGLVKTFSLGDPIETGDFEALAISPNGVFHMITSRGVLYLFREGEDGARVAFNTIDIGMDRTCEIEGLAYAPTEDGLIIACKHMNARGMRDRVSLYFWREGAEPAPWLTLPERDLATRAGLAHFRPSGVEIDPVSGRVLVLSAAQGAMAELDPQGGVLSVRALGRGHRQAEGLTIGADGALLIADEAAGGQATLSRYARVP
jgi:uncharacterized protein YjiK